MLSEDSASSPGLPNTANFSLTESKEHIVYMLNTPIVYINMVMCGVDGFFKKNNGKCFTPVSEADYNALRVVILLHYVTRYPNTVNQSTTV